MLLLHLLEAYFGLNGRQKTTMKKIRIKQKIHVAFNKLCKKQHDIWVLDQGEGQDGWILAKFCFCMFMNRVREPSQGQGL